MTFSDNLWRDTYSHHHRRGGARGWPAREVTKVVNTTNALRLCENLPASPSVYNTSARERRHTNIIHGGVKMFEFVGFIGREKVGRDYSVGYYVRTKQRSNRLRARELEGYPRRYCDTILSLNRCQLWESRNSQGLQTIPRGDIYFVFTIVAKCFQGSNTSAHRFAR